MRRLVDVDLGLEPLWRSPDLGCPACAAGEVPCRYCDADPDLHEEAA